MDLLYSRYSNPLELMRLYINQGRFGEFVSAILDLDEKRKREENEKEDEQKMWELYLHSSSDKSFDEWKKDIIDNSKAQSVSLSMNDSQVEEVKEKARKILYSFSPN